MNAILKMKWKKIALKLWSEDQMWKINAKSIQTVHILNTYWQSQGFKKVVEVIQEERLSQRPSQKGF